jgi:hypothetical protein
MVGGTGFETEMADSQHTEATLIGDDAGSDSAPRMLGRRISAKTLMVAAAAIVFVVSLACLTLLQLGYPRLQGVVAPNIIRPSQELSFIAPVPQPRSWGGLFTLVSDSTADPQASTLKLFEDGVAIGPPHTSHSVVAKGGGSYAHWGENLYFSTTRGDDPRTSGREYRVLAVYQPAVWIAPALMVLAALSGAALLALTLGRSTFSVLGKFIPPVVYTATVAALLLMAVTSFVEFHQVQKLEPGKIRASQGYSFATTIPVSPGAIPFLEPIRENRTSTGKPTTVLLEDGEELRMPRSRAQLVQTIGTGRYVLSNTNVLFSTPDNSDPRTNGRSYAVQERLGLPAGFEIAVFLLVVTSLFMLGRKRAALVYGGLSAAAAIGGIVGTLSYFDLITQDEYVSPADIAHVVGKTYTFRVSGIVAPFAYVAPVGAPTAIGLGDIVLACADRPQSAAKLDTGGSGACAPRSSSVDVDFVRPAGVAESVAPSFYRYAVRVHWYAVLGLFVLSAVFALALWFRPATRQAVIGTGALIGAVGSLLMAANIAGFFFDLRVTMPTEPVQGIRLNTPRLPFEEGLKLLAWREGDTPESYGRRANQVVYDSMVHGDPSSDLGRWRLEVPVWENWSLHGLGVMNPAFRKYRFWSHEKEFERGIGLCGHLSAILIGYMNENGIPARIVGLQGHVVVTAEVRPGVWYIFDPDYGVVMPHSLDEVEANPDLVHQAYMNATDERMRNMVVDFYRSDVDNSIDPSGRDGMYSGLDGSAEVFRQRERLAEQIKWPVPAGLMATGLVIGLIGFFWRRRRRDDPETAEDAITGTASAEARPA